MRFSIIDAKRADYPITVLCRALGVSRAGYYASLSRPLSRRADEDRRLAALVREAHGVFVSRKRVIRIMQQEGLKARVRSCYRVTTMSDHDQPVAPNILDRQFTAEKPNQRWVGDTTELVT